VIDTQHQLWFGKIRLPGGGLFFNGITNLQAVGILIAM